MPSRLHRPRRGSVMLWGMITIFMLFGFATLAVDFGRVQVAQSQIQSATDAAVRAAGQKFADGGDVGEILAAAVGVANSNMVDGVPVVVRRSSLHLGVYDPVKKKFFETDNINACNAIRIELSHQFGSDGGALAFAPLIGSGDRTVSHRATVMIGDVPAGWNEATYTVTTPPVTTTTPDTIVTETTVKTIFTAATPPTAPTPPQPAATPPPPTKTSTASTSGKTTKRTSTATATKGSTSGTKGTTASKKTTTSTNTTVIKGTTTTTPGTTSTTTTQTPTPARKRVVQVE